MNDKQHVQNLNGQSLISALRGQLEGLESIKVANLTTMQIDIFTSFKMVPGRLVLPIPRCSFSQGTTLRMLCMSRVFSYRC